MLRIRRSGHNTCMCRIWKRFLSVLLVACCAGCMPMDPEGTLNRARGGTLRIGISHNPPFALADKSEPGGIEVELIQPLLESLGSGVEWTVAGESELFERLEKFELDLVLGGLTDDTPWSKRLGFTRPYLEREVRGVTRRHVLAVPPGENAWLFTLDEHLSRHREKARQFLEGEQAP